MNMRASRRRNPVKRTKRSRAEHNGAPPKYGKGVPVHAADLTEDLVDLIEQAAKTYETSAKLLHEMAAVISLNSSNHSYEVARLLETARTLRRNAARIKRRAAVIAGWRLPQK